MFNRTRQNLDDASAYVEKLLESTNQATKSVATLHVSFMLFAAYLFVIVWGTTHEDLLFNNPIELPILSVEVPLTTFYGSVPWMVFLLHFNLLLQLELLSRKLWSLNQNIDNLSNEDKIRERLVIFPFTHLISGSSSNQIITWLLSFVVGFSTIVFPLFILLGIQIRFLSFHDEPITWLQRLAVWADSMLILFLWPLIASSKDRSCDWWRIVYFRLTKYPYSLIRYYVLYAWNRVTHWTNHNTHLIENTCIHHPQAGESPKGMIALLASLPIAILTSIVAVIPGNITEYNYYHLPLNQSHQTDYHFEDWLILHSPSESLLSVLDVMKVQADNCKPLSPSNDTPNKVTRRVTLWITCINFDLGYFQRNLNLTQLMVLPKKEDSLSLLADITNLNKSTRDISLKEFSGHNLRGRDLRFANLHRSILPKTDLSNAKLEGADLQWVDFQSATLMATNLQGANMTTASLQGADLRWANLNSTDLRAADLQAADLQNAQLLNADIRGANLRGVDLRESKLYKALFSGAKMQGANLQRAELQGAELKRTDLQGVDFSSANLQGADFSWSSLEAATFPYKFIEMATWKETNLDFLNIVDISVPDSVKPEPELDKYQTLKSILNETEYKNFLQQLLKTKDKDEPFSSKDCFSIRPTTLNCKSDDQDSYKKNVLYPKLIKLACSNAAIAESIAIRGYVYNEFTPEIIPDAKLAQTMLDLQNTCDVHNLISEQTKQKLQDFIDKDVDDKRREEHKRLADQIKAKGIEKQNNKK